MAPIEILDPTVEPRKQPLTYVPRPDSLRYTKTPSRTNASASSELLYVKLRYKPPTGVQSREIAHIVADAVSHAHETH